MKCLVIAAGKGSRLLQKEESKPLMPLLGIPLIERVIRTANDAGADDFYVVTGFQAERVQSFLGNLSNRLKISITSIFNKVIENGKILCVSCSSCCIYNSSSIEMMFNF